MTVFSLRRALRPVRASGRAAVFASSLGIASAAVAAPAVSGAAAPAAGAAVRAPALVPATIDKAIAVDSPPIFPLSAIKPGMRGKSYTVFSSRRGPEPFEVEILGVMRSYLGPGEDLIICQLHGPQVERTGVIAGMSGSPVYIDGKLVGAIGYRFGSFTRDPICGVTPIESMLRTDGPSGAPAKGATTAYGQAEPIAVPVAVSGVPERVLAGFRDMLSARGYGPVFPTGAGATAAGAASGPAERFYASGPIAGLMVEGDIQMAGIGTVTWVSGDRFLAFGHPFLGLGITEMPVSNADIITTVASDAGSWKMGQATTPVGRLTNDRLTAIGGRMGERPALIPVHIDVAAAGPRVSSDQKPALDLRVMNHPSDVPMYIAMGVATALSGRLGAEATGGTADVTVRATLAGGEQVDLAFRTADDQGNLDLPAAFAVLAGLSALTEQDFLKTRLTRVDVRVQLSSDVKKTRIVAVDPLSPLRAGASATLRVRLQRERGVLREEQLSFRLPKGVPTGTYQLVVAGSAEAARVERDTGIVAVPRTFAGYLDAVRALPPPGSVSVYLVRDDPAVRIEGQAALGLPPSLLGVLSEASGLSGAPLEARGARLLRMPSSEVITGELGTRVTIDAAEPD